MFFLAHMSKYNYYEKCILNIFQYVKKILKKIYIQIYYVRTQCFVGRRYSLWAVAKWQINVSWEAIWKHQKLFFIQITKNIILSQKFVCGHRMGVQLQKKIRFFFWYLKIGFWNNRCIYTGPRPFAPYMRPYSSMETEEILFYSCSLILTWSPTKTFAGNMIAQSLKILKGKCAHWEDNII
jgi:hypothetical protein